MKFPKTRANIYVIVRIIGGTTSLLGSFSDLVEADDFKDACASEWFDTTKDTSAHFEVRLTTFYG
jgi:hypothetical protein